MKPNRKRHAVVAALSVAAMLGAIAVPSAVAGDSHHSHHHKKHRRRTVKSRGGALSLQLGTLKIAAPKGAVRKGQTLTIETGIPKKFPALDTASIAGGPYTISTSQGEPAKPVKVTFHYNPAGLTQGGSPVVLHGWNAFGNWLPEETKVNVSAKTVSTQLDNFSPIDVVEDITWAAGLITGNRTDLPSGCGAAPSWVDGLSFPDVPNDSLPSCIGSGSNASTLYIHVVNNRGYAQFVTTSGASIDVSRSSWRDSLESTIANGLAKLSTGNTPSSFLLAPGSQATIAIDRPPSSFGETTVTLHSAPQGSTAAAAMGWALLNKLEAELGSGVDATNCVIGYLHNTLSGDPSVSSVVGQLHSCASAAAASLKGSAKTAAEKIASAVLVTDFFYKLIDLETAEAYPPEISFSIPGENPTNPDIHLGNLDFGTLPVGRQTVEHLTASGGTAPYSFAIWNDPSNEANVPSWVNVASDGTVTIDPPSGTDQSVNFYVYATDANGEHSPFAREEVAFSVGGGGGAGMSWSATAMPVPNNGKPDSGEAYGSACSSNGTCVVTGAYVSGNVGRSMIDTLAGGFWSAIETPVPARSPFDYGPACSSNGTCVVSVSSAPSNHVEERSIIDTLAGASWSTIEVPVPAGGEVGSGDAYPPTCSSDGTCVLPGRYKTPGGEEHSMIDTLTGGSWSAIEVPIPAGGEAGSGSVDTYYSVACSSDGTCVLPGGYKTLGGEERGMIDTLTGGSWSAIEVPIPTGGEAGSGGGDFPTCSSNGTCELLGGYKITGGAWRSMIDTLAGGSWSAIEMPVPAGGEAGSGSETVYSACSSNGTCALLGGYKTSAGEGRSMIDTLAGGSWSAIEMPVPAGGEAGSGSRTEYSACSSDGTCVLPGGYKTLGGEERSMIDTLAGGSWSAIETPVPVGGETGSGEASGLACQSNGTCVLPGEYQTPGDRERPMIDTLAGGSWSAIEAPVPAGGEAGLYLTSAACSSNGTCVLPGQYETPGGEDHSMFVIGEQDP